MSRKIDGSKMFAQGSLDEPELDVLSEHSDQQIDRINIIRDSITNLSIDKKTKNVSL